jgi:hypothetical protein
MLAEEVWTQTDGEIDALVQSVGTAGLASGHRGGPYATAIEVHSSLQGQFQIGDLAAKSTFRKTGDLLGEEVP